MKYHKNILCALVMLTASLYSQDRIGVKNNNLQKGNQQGTIDINNKTLTYKATVFNTNFVVPLVRFNFNDSESSEESLGNVSFFNSIGAGISWSMGRLEETRGNDGNRINTQFYNTFGVQLGFLFSAKTGAASTNIFAPTLGLNLLNFQLGFGYEFGTVGANQKRGFLTIAYAIPVSKLVKGGFWVQTKDPQPVEDSEGGFY